MPRIATSVRRKEGRHGIANHSQQKPPIKSPLPAFARAVQDQELAVAVFALPEKGVAVSDSVLFPDILCCSPSERGRPWRLRGPDQTLEGVPTVLIVVFLAIIVRGHAVRADATLGKSKTPDAGIGLLRGGPSRWRTRPPAHGARLHAVSDGNSAHIGRFPWWRVGCERRGVAHLAVLRFWNRPGGNPTSACDDCLGYFGDRHRCPHRGLCAQRRDAVA
jgi:hypothetical protein